ncbi:hypothetical protein LPTSP3_g21630 [Leptospira kobayashii]|uniref:Luciferase-like domain-containing protein n=1 Tax=Leptospira kobayashii TaxID=1917830 RepID=A0ABN6KHE8_9LEPT|nr:LLM class flavin-dependent oxidoreductase [Leptospira kobayashii]BDA79233.1 hypothetical protein LPTSP3_g21630 [Leptospira kobayashii]
MNPAAKSISNIPLSVLDLVPITEGTSPSLSIQRSLDLAKKTEALGYNRIWFAEHHNMLGIGSAATSIIIGYVANGTSKIRVGSGGIMLPNHAPMVIAEQFGTLEALFPGRIDLGLGRAPGTDQLTTHALRRDKISGGQEFSDQLDELRYFLAPGFPGQKVRAVPGMGSSTPIWLLGSSGYSAELAGRLGLPFSFASHFAPEQLMYAIDLYKRVFTPSDVLDKPYIMLGVNLVAAESDEEAEKLATSQIISFLGLLRGNPKQMGPPLESLEGHWTPMEKAHIEQRLGSSVLGSPSTVKQKLNDFIEKTGADELIVNTMVYDYEKRIRSYEILSQIKKEAPVMV